MTCNCCLSDNIKINPRGLIGYSWCEKCKYLFANNRFNEELSQTILDYYQYEDPYKDVSNSKISFYNYALRHLKNKVTANERTILDIGCGYGYFLDLASQKKWKPFGIEIVPNAVDKCRHKFGNRNIFHGELKRAGLAEKSFDAITFWDVIAIVDNPYNELKESYRLLKNGGILGVRTRNVIFQLFIFRIFNLFQKFVLRFGFKPPYVFNKYCFSAKSFRILLSRLGYTNIQIINSPCTTGDPYRHMPFNYPVEMTKIFLDIFSTLVYFITRGRWLTAPSLLIWAQKP